MAPSEPALRPLLKDQAYQALKEGIIGGTFAPGTFLSERQLAARLEMSKTPVRAALERLENEGFVAVSPQQGIVVRELPLHEIVDLFDIRVALETFVLRASAGRLDAGQVARLEANLAEQKESAEREDQARSTRLDADFHLMLCEFSGNREILRVMERLRDKLFQVVLKIHLQDVKRLHTSYAEHAAIARALIDGDGEAAAAQAAEHLQYGKQFLVSR